jgi:hypothetical protein
MLNIIIKKMKSLMLFLSCACFFSIQAQSTSENKEPIAKFEIRDARENDSDITPQVLSDNAYLVFYLSNDGSEVMFSNYRETPATQCYGKIYSIKKDDNPETDKDYRHTVYNFQWSYTDTDGDNNGTAQVKLFLVYKTKGIYFECTVIKENLDEFQYKGIMTGDVSAIDSKISE